MDLKSPKPFPCNEPGCKASFNTEDHLSTHARRHELTQLELPVKSALFSDKTPTPTRTVDRLLKNCDAVGLFDDLQNVNPFDETFRKAVESNQPVDLCNSPMKVLADVTEAATGDGDLNTPNCFPMSTKPAESGKPAPVDNFKTELPEIQITNELPEDKQTAIKKPRLMLKNRIISAVKKPPKILPKPSPNFHPSSAQILLKDNILRLSIPPPPPEPWQLNTVRNRKPYIKKGKKSESVTVEDSNREAARRYRQRVKVLQHSLVQENDKLKAENKKLKEENESLKKKIVELTAAKTVSLTQGAAQGPTAAATTQFCIIIKGEK